MAARAANFFLPLQIYFHVRCLSVCLSVLSARASNISCFFLLLTHLFLTVIFSKSLNQKHSLKIGKDPCDLEEPEGIGGTLVLWSPGLGPGGAWITVGCVNHGGIRGSDPDLAKEFVEVGIPPY